MSVDLLATRRFLFPGPLAQGALEALRDHGTRGDELFIALTAVIGEERPETVRISRALIPAQASHRTPQGLLVTIDGDALYELNRRCYELGEVLVAQIHAHPGDAFHSRADDRLAFVRLPGGLSIVVPDFAGRGLRPEGWSVNQLAPDGLWGALPDEVELEIA